MPQQHAILQTLGNHGTKWNLYVIENNIMVLFNVQQFSKQITFNFSKKLSYMLENNNFQSWEILTECTDFANWCCFIKQEQMSLDLIKDYQPPQFSEKSSSHFGDNWVFLKITTSYQKTDVPMTLRTIAKEESSFYIWHLFWIKSTPKNMFFLDHEHFHQIPFC